MKRTSRMITLLRKEEKGSKKTDLETREIRPITMSEVFEMVSFPRKHFRASLFRFFLPQENKQRRRNQALRG